MSAGRLDRLALFASVAALAALQLWLRPLLPVDETRYEDSPASPYRLEESEGQNQEAAAKAGAKAEEKAREHP